MKRRLWRRRAAGLAILVAACLLIPGANAADLRLAPFKDELFAYPQPVASRQGGAFLDVPYSEARDIDRRDEVPERRVKRAYVDLAPTRTQREETRRSEAGDIRILSLGERKAPKAIVVFVHGRNGDRRLGMNDWTFGGNFNRLKNLVGRAGGLYVTVDGGQLGITDAAKVGGLMWQLRARHANAPIVLACGSMGGELCWTMLADGKTAAGIDGLVLLGANSDITRFRRMAEGRKRALPILLAQGSRDKVYPLAAQEAFFDQLRQERPGYPLRFVAFESGNHGTPFRMIDWRDTLNWILSR